MKSYVEYTVVIPTLNERDNIITLLDMLRELYHGISIIVVDDGSPDGTCTILKSYGKIHSRLHICDRANKEIHGLTVSVLEGFRFVKTPYTIVMDGDLQHPPEILKSMIKQSHSADLVVGWRKRVHKWRIDRRLMSLIATSLARMRLLGKTAPRDILSGLFLVRTKLIKETLHAHNFKKYELKGYKILFDFVKMQQFPLRIKNVSYDFGFRDTGESKMGLKHGFLFIRSLFK
jgi:dolichol-phosphate mannosyltransferase